MIPSAWAFLATPRNAAKNDCKFYVSRTQRSFGEGKSTGGAGERHSTCLEQKPQSESKHIEEGKKSRISSIRCENFAGMTNGKHGESSEDDNIIVLNFDDTTLTPSMTTEECLKQQGDENGIGAFEGNLVCVTGETGSGKSLLVSKIADLLTGGKASATLLQSARNTTSAKKTDNDGYVEDSETTSAASTEMVLSLHDEAHISFVSTSLRRMGLDPNTVLQRPDGDGSTNRQRGSKVRLILKRVISMTPPSMNNDNKAIDDTGKSKRQRIKSTCFINGHSVPLKVLKAIASPLIAVVNAPVAATALGRPASRLSMIDSGISPSVLAWVDQLQTKYRECKQYRESLERDLENQVLPASMVRRGIVSGEENDALSSPSENNQQLDLLRHWVDELDGFERRISDLQDSLYSGSESSTNQIGDEELEFLLSKLNALDWTPDYSDGVQIDETYSSSLYETLLDLHDYLRSMDARIIAATEARDSLASLSVSDSARAALDRTRQLLLDAAAPHQRKDEEVGSARGNKKSRVDVATEKAHENLNLVEDALMECSNFLDDDDKGLMATLRACRNSYSSGTEELLEYITEWNVLSRKHGVSPYQLTSCHAALKKELDGGIEAGRLLPGAKAAEKEALAELKEGSEVLTKARSELCQRISDSVSRRLPRLGMENSKFEARLCPIGSPSYSKSHLGADEVDFYLLHEDPTASANGSNETEEDFQDQLIGGKIESVASSGEKARVLLAIECEIPGSISATSQENWTGGEKDQSAHLSPVAVIYDEIDAHVGGRASISVAQMLFDQSKACQVLSITHSPSLAAIADTHICVHRGKSDSNGRMFDVVAGRVDGVERRKELARMASGDTVVNEAEVFAEALLRDASSIRNKSQDLKP
jgi:DNA repair ATPase RecN